ncbi:MAG TPA: TolC family protein [Gemmatimonadales bacterium]|nr:TolC family protein [Gemmatimonadales bacterium]
MTQLRALRLSTLALLAALAWPPARAAAQAPVPPAPTGRALSLEEALQRAQGASEAVGIARAGVLRARGDLQRARSEFFPQLTGTGTYTRTLRSQFSALESSDSTPADTTSAPASCTAFAPPAGLPIEQRVDSLEQAVKCLSSVNPFASFSRLPFGQKNTWNFGLQASQTLFAGGRIVAQSNAAKALLRSAEIGLTSQQAQLVLDVTQAYYDAALSDRLVGIAEAALEQAERTLSETRLAREVGNQPEFELLRAQVQRDNQRPVVIQRRAQRDVAYLRLKQLLNLPLGEAVALTTSLEDSTGAPPALVLPAGYGEPARADTATAARAPVRQAGEGVAAAEGQYRVSRAQNLPSLVLSTAFAEIAFPSSLFPGGNDFVSDWNVSLALRWPLFTGGRIGGEKLAARAGIEEARLRLRQTQELAELDARNTAAQLAAAEAAWEASAGTVEQATRAYGIAEIRYREGISTQTELSDARLLLQQAQANRAQAARDLQVARVRTALLRDLPLGGTPTGSAAAGAAAQTPALPTTPAPAPAPAPGGVPTTGATAQTAAGGLR